MISKRLKTIASFIKENSNVIDVGCDHALLDIYLTKHKNCNCIASDINKNALQMAKNNIKKYNLEDKIETILSDGLENIQINKPSTVIISGMGTTTILKILEKADNTFIDNFIISTHNDYELFRKNICKKYHIVDETIIEDKNKFYLILNIVKGKTKYTKKDIYLGPILKNKKDKEIHKYYEYVYNKNNEIIKKISNKQYLKKIKLKKYNKWIKKLNSY